MREAPGRGAASSGPVAYALAAEEDASPVARLLEEDLDASPSQDASKQRRSTMSHIDFVLAAAEPASDVPTLNVVAPEAEAEMSISLSANLGDYRRVRKHSRVVAEVFHTEDELVCSLQDAVSTCEQRLAKLR